MYRKISSLLRICVIALVSLTVVLPDGVGFEAYAGQSTSQASAGAKKKKKRRKKSSGKRKRNKRSRKAAKKSSAPKEPLVVQGSNDPIEAPESFVTLPSVAEAPDGMRGRTLAIWPSHGKYYDNGWKWQRPRLFGTVEDLLSRSFVDPYLVPMLENAGAYVMLPRERDFSKTATIVDYDVNQGDKRFSTTAGRHRWELENTGYGLRRNYIENGENPFTMGRSGKVKTVSVGDSAHCSTANWYGSVTETGRRAVYVSYQSYPNSAPDATYTVNHLGGSSQVVVNQRMGGGTWVYIGTYPFAAGLQEKPLVTLTNMSEDDDAVVSADAVKVGGGMGFVARGGSGEYAVSGYPAYLEGSRYYLQGAGFPTWVYDTPDGDDYIDDYKSRALWVNHMAGGSEMFPDTIGLGIPVDMALAFHTDAGFHTDSTTVGTLGLYSTDDGNPLGNGTSRYANRDLTDDITRQVVGDIRAAYDPDWADRSYRDRKYYEVRETKVPAMILELLSHQSFEDMKRAWDPEFRFLVGRAVYKGIGRFLARRYDLNFVVQPLPVNTFGIHADSNGYYTLSWEPTIDPLEKSATPTFYIVYEAVDGLAFRPVATTPVSSWSVKVSDDKIHSYYIVAANDGGVSFPSEVLSLYDKDNRMPSVEIVNGYTRVAGPAWTDGPTYAGFEFDSTYGVPDGADVHFVGNQYDMDPSSTLISTNPSFGSSGSDEEGNIRTGNTRDYTYIHGVALRNAGRGFVSSSLAAFEKGTSAPKAVDLILGQQKTTRKAAHRGRFYQTFPKALRQRIEQFRRRGGALLVSGSYLSSEIIEADSLTRDTMALFASDMLGYKPYLPDGANDSVVPRATRTFRVENGARMSGVPVLGSSEIASLANGSWVGAGNPQSIAPVDNRGLVIGRYSDTKYPAAIAVDGKRRSHQGLEYPGRVVVASFPIESMKDAASRNIFVADAMQYLIGDDLPEVKAQPMPVSTKDDADKNKKNKKNKKKKAKKQKKQKK